MLSLPADIKDKIFYSCEIPCDPAVCHDHAWQGTDIMQQP